MPVLRELVSRFSFDVDKKSVKNYDATIGGMKKSALKLGAALGLSLGGKALFQAGTQALTAEENLKRIAGTKFSLLESNLDSVRVKLDSIRQGAGSILTDKTFQMLGADFFKSFDISNKTIKQFTTLLESASVQAISTKGSISEIFSGLQAAIETGDVGAIKDIGGFNLAQVKFLQAQLAQIDAGEFAQDISMKKRGEVVTNLLKKLRPAQEKQLKAIGGEFFDIQVAQKTVDQFTEQASEAVTSWLVRKSASSIDIYKRLFEGDIKGISRDVGRQIMSVLPTDEEEIRKEKPKEKTNSLLNYLRQQQAVDKTAREQSKRNVEINMNTTIHVNEATDAAGVAKIVKSEDQRRLQEAREQLIKSEDMK